MVCMRESVPLAHALESKIWVILAPTSAFRGVSVLFASKQHAYEGELAKKLEKKQLLRGNEQEPRCKHALQPG